MRFLKQAYTRFFNNKVLIIIYFIIINLPLLISTFDTANWSDDYQYTNLIAVKAKFSPLLSVILDTTGGHIGKGGHFAPFYNAINIAITSVTTNPQFFHLMIGICYVITAYFIFLMVDRYYGDKPLGILAGTLFALNYYVGFRAYAYNCFHSHLTNTLTGIASLYFFIRYLQERKKSCLLICLFCFLLTIFNYESGFVFFPILIITAFFFWLRKNINSKKLTALILLISMVFALFPVGAYLQTGKAFPLSYRFQTSSTDWKRNIQEYAFIANELFIKSAGISIFYNKFVFDKLEQNPQLKQIAKQLIRERKNIALMNIPARFLFIGAMLGLFSIILFIAILLIILKRIRPRTYLFLILYACLFLLYVFIFYRVDITNAISLFSSIIIADLIISFLRDKNKGYRRIGIGILAIYLALTAWTVMDKFDDCYKKSFQGLSKMAMRGPDTIYNEINRKIGRFAKDGVIIFTHDYSPYHQTGGFERIGDLIGAVDFACFNATEFYKDLLNTGIVEEYRNRSLLEFQESFRPELYRKIIVSSRNEALGYLRANNIDTKRVAAIYISKDYKVTKF